jgi:SAM-dependent methyltransferase
MSVGDSESTVPNFEQSLAWSGDTGQFWAKNADRFDRRTAAYVPDILAAAAISPTDAVLDVGCGAGATTIQAARCASQGSATGIDISPPLLQVAEQRRITSAILNASFVYADAQTYLFEHGTFDVVISRTGVMFFDDPPAAFRNLAYATKPNGRLALLTWQPVTDNEWFAVIYLAITGEVPPSPAPGTPSPFGLSNAQFVHDLLSAAGFADVELTSVRHPMDFGDTPEEAAMFLTDFMSWALDSMSHADRAGALDRLDQTIRAHCSDGRVLFGSAAWLVTGRKG